MPASMKPMAWRRSVFANLSSVPLTELKVFGEQDARDLLTDVATAHTQTAGTSKTPERHRAGVAIVRRILDGKDGMRG